MAFQNPLRYPGAKNYIIDYLEKVLNTNGIQAPHIIEPYAGSATASLQLLQRGSAAECTLIERDPLIYSFWKSVFNDTDRLVEKIRESEISVETWANMLHLRDVDHPTPGRVLELGFAGLFFNRTNFSGILMANPIGGWKQLSKYKIDCRFNKERIIQNIQEISNLKDRVHVVFGDALSYLSDNRVRLHEQNTFVFLDPPYVGQGENLYRYYYDTEDHTALSRLIKQSHYPWLVVYDDHPLITDLYFGDGSNLNRQHLYIDYSTRKHKKGKEILISNIVIPPYSAKMDEIIA